MSNTTNSAGRGIGPIAIFPGLCAGTPVLTLDGALPVEDLAAGDRVITRNGVRSLRAVHAEVHRDAAMIRVRASALGGAQPASDLLIPQNQQILIRDWRAKAFNGADQAVICADGLIDGTHFCAETVAEQRLFRLEFDTAVVIYAGGLELTCAAGIGAA